MGYYYRWSSSGIHTWAPAFLLYVNDIPHVISNISNPILCADDSSLIITNSDSQMFEKSKNTAILQLNKWFNSNLLLLNLKKKKNLFSPIFN